MIFVRASYFRGSLVWGAMMAAAAFRCGTPQLRAQNAQLGPSIPIATPNRKATADDPREMAEPSQLEAHAEPIKDLSDLDIDQLTKTPVVVPAFDVTVTSVAKEPTKVGVSPAAIYVITQEDIRRSGARNIPDLLRMVPGIHVGQINSHLWSVSSRGFSEQFTDKLLVLIDGRTVFQPFFNGVNWDQEDVVLDDIERIEVIRGPGATLWGSNAVNGVINIITKKAQDTQGTLLLGGAGTEELGFGAIRLGGKLGDNAYYRIFTKYLNRDDTLDLMGHDDVTEWNMFRAGFRIDWDPTDCDSCTFVGDIYTGVEGVQSSFSLLGPPFLQQFTDRQVLNGGDVLGRWTHRCADDSTLMFQLYYWRYERDQRAFFESRDTVDLEFQRNLWLGECHDIVWGLGYRLSSDDTAGDPRGVVLHPASLDRHVCNFFVQDDITLIEDLLHVIPGSKFELNSVTDFEVQPSIRLAYTPDKRNTVWGAVSRAVRIPDRFERGAQLRAATFDPDGPGPAPLNELVVLGSPSFDAETELSYELGYRTSPTDKLSFDFAGFFNQYDNLETTEPRTPFFTATPPPPHLVIPLVFNNLADGEIYGFEASANWDVSECWKLRAGYSWLQIQIHPDNSSADSTAEDPEGRSPHNICHVRSFVDLGCHWKFDTALYYVDNLPTIDIPRYLRWDIRLAWEPRPNLEFVLGLQNLLDAQHPEFSGIETSGSQMERSIYGMGILKF